jgi:protein SCO1/2
VRLSLYEAAEGKVRSPVDQILLFCFNYDSERGRYGLAALRLMQIGGGLTVVVLGGAIWVFRRREKAKNRVPKTGESG